MAGIVNGKRDEVAEPGRVIRAKVVQAFRSAVSGGPEGPHDIRAISSQALQPDRVTRCFKN
jgi:hypothetical protein